MKCAVLGHPIRHSKSPIIHQYWMDRHDIDGLYKSIDIAPENLKQEVGRLIQKEGYVGFNVTVPHKQAVMACCDVVEPVAQAIGAVNTIYIDDNQIVGTNTDAFGFIENIKRNGDFIFSDKVACVLGAGGAARAVIYGLINAGVSKIYLTNRTRHKAEELLSMAQDKIQIIDWGERSEVLHDVDLLVNTTSLGMLDKPELKIDLQFLSPHAVVNDIVYSPLMTDLLSRAKQSGNPTVTGIGMLLYQAAPAFEKWANIMPSITTELQSMVLK